MKAAWRALRLVLTLALAGVVAGSVLAGVHLLTRPAIERHRAEALERGVFRVLPGTEEIRPWLLDGGGLRPAEAAGAAEAVPAEGDDARPVWEGIGAAGDRRGFAVVAEGAGFQDTIRLLYGLDPERRQITGVAILESRETPGLGDKILDDEDFHRSLRGLAVDPRIEVVMGRPTEPNEVDGITGATISSQAVAEILDASARSVLDRLETALETTPETAPETPPQNTEPPHE